MRQETDFLGTVTLADDFPFGIHTWRAMRNFAFSADRLHRDIFASVIEVKMAAARANRRAGLLEEKLAVAIEQACANILAHIDSFVSSLHPLQGGAGTSVNMAANELVANMALRVSGKNFGQYETISPLAHVNLSQSTNDVFPTAVKIAVLRGLQRLHDAVERLLQVLLAKEKEFAAILKVGRTELQDAMPLALGQEFSAWAEAMARFRWRLDKAVEWLREVNLSGTAVGTGINADRRYAACVMEELRAITHLPLALARNLVDSTQNVDPIVEISGLVRTGAVAVKKMAADLRLLSSGPQCGIGELLLPDLQAGSSIMPGKVNPVMLEAAEQVCLQVMGGDGVIAIASAESNLELPQFLPLIAHVLVGNLELFSGLLLPLADTIQAIKANAEKIAAYVDRSYAVATLLSPLIGYETAAALVKEAAASGRPILALIRERQLVSEEKLRRLLTPEAMAAPGLFLAGEDDR